MHMYACIIDVVSMCIVLIDTYIHMYLYRSCYIFPYTVTIVANMGEFGFAYAYNVGYQ